MKFQVCIALAVFREFWMGAFFNSTFFFKLKCSNSWMTLFCIDSHALPHLRFTHFLLTYITSSSCQTLQNNGLHSQAQSKPSLFIGSNSKSQMPRKTDNPVHIDWWKAVALIPLSCCRQTRVSQNACSVCCGSSRSCKSLCIPNSQQIPQHHHHQ